MRFVAELDVFASERRGALERADERLGGSVAAALIRHFRTPNAGWYDNLLNAVREVWDQTYEAEGGDPAGGAEAREMFIDRIRESLADHTSASSGVRATRETQGERITRWLSTATINDATASLASEEGATLEWVTMGDNNVRDTHRQANGQTVLAGEPFDIGGFDLTYPGEPVGPPDIWIECRCVVRPSVGGEMSGAIATFEIKEDLEGNDEVVDLTRDQDTEDPEDLDHRVRFHGILAPIGQKTGDGRIFEEGSITWRDGASPVALRWVKSDTGMHQGAVRVANFDRIWIEGNSVMGEGYFLDVPEAGEVIGMAAEAPLGVSVDLDSMVVTPRNEDGSEFDFDKWEMGDPEPLMSVTEGRISGATIVDIPAFQEAFIALGPWEEPEDGDYNPDEALVASCAPCEAAVALEKAHDEMTDEEFEAHVENLFAPGTKDGPGWITNPKETQRLRTYWTKGAGAAKIRWGAPGDFNRCRKQLAKYVKNPAWLAGTCANLHKVALGIWPGQEKGNRHSVEAIVAAATPAWNLVASEDENLVAAGGRRVLPAEWFGDPNFSAPTPMTVTDDGQIYGHIATWGVCHLSINAAMGFGDACVTAPHSQRDYAYFKTGAVKTTIGDVAIGNITMNTGHAALTLNQKNALKHYDETGTVVADVNVGEDEFGIWFAGALRPNLEGADIDALCAATLSGDWRRVGTGQEMVAALAVNVPGFPIVSPSVAAADGSSYALVAAGGLRPSPKASLSTENIVAFDITALAKEVVKQMDAARDRDARVYAARERIRAARLSAVRAKFAAK